MEDYCGTCGSWWGCEHRPDPERARLIVVDRTTGAPVMERPGPRVVIRQDFYLTQVGEIIFEPPVLIKPGLYYMTPTGLAPYPTRWP